VTLLAVAGIVAFSRHRVTGTPPSASRASGAAAVPASNPAMNGVARVPPPGLAGQSSVRIACGRTKTHTDRWGEVWEPDRDYEGGTPFEIHRQFIARAYDAKLFQAGRTGNFSYKIPLAPGVYELHLYFIEGTYGPAMPAGGGEISRLFEVRVNGQPLLSRFDIYSDAGGSNVADVRVFKDISPGPGQVLTLTFQSQTGLALINAIEVIPASPHHLNPIRIVAQDGFYTDSTGTVWRPDRYYSGGQTASHSVEMHGTRDPDLFVRERYGHFDYAIPVDKGTYRLTLYFAEEYFVPGMPQGVKAGTRVFDVTCNGVALLREFDLFKEGGPGQAIVKTFHGLTPNGQGTLLVSFAPIHDYASLYALEVIDESN
jgi:Malectin domain